jgi:lysozyme family protein
MFGSFPACLHFTLREEGGNVDDPEDPGGRTSRGVTQKVYNAYRGEHPHLHPDVFEAPQAAIEAIYREQYWKPYGDQLPAGLDLIFFDYSVNSGRQQAVKTLQRALGVNPDGMFGIITRDAIDAADIPALIRAYCEGRRTFFRGLAKFPRYGKNWLGRTTRCEAAALSMAQAAAAAAGAIPVPRPRPDDFDEIGALIEASPAPAAPKANPTEVSEPTIAPEKGAVAAGGAGSIAGMLQQIQETLAPYAYAIRTAQYILIGVAVVGFGLSVWGFLHRSKVKEMVG